ncbi:glycosyltransferase 61 family protein [Microbacterium sp. ARD32]|uniref:glycosyltransferase family 61 protein n=1 Tax=Microbacterium sp. ARD32 TaxID=2962577 RepID=UPI0028823301|nr:glycosyltransferase 61 family protein [Microbacterium sp. ARD32]MDT0156402.1 glycosyltransferase 61 family protein [Microbacterium sp. ARD32]
MGSRSDARRPNVAAEPECESSPERSVLPAIDDAVRDHLATIDSPRFVVVTDEPDHGVEALAERWRGARGYMEFRRSGLPLLKSDKRVHGWFTTSAELRSLLAEHGPFDAIIDARRTTERSTARFWGWAQAYLRKGGLHVVVDGAEHSVESRMPGWVAGTPSTLTIGDWRAIAAAKSTASEYTALEDGFAITQGSRYLHVVNEAAAARGVLQETLQKTSVETIDTLPSVDFRSDAVVTHHNLTRPPKNLETEFLAPAMTLRHYSGEIRFHGQMAASVEDTLLPHSFRCPWSTWRHHTVPASVATFTDNSIFLLNDADEAPFLPDRPYIDLTHPYSGHFGHVIAQGLARTWGVSRALERYPEAKVLLQRRWNYAKNPNANAFGILELAGISDERIEWVTGPVRMRSFIVPSLGLQYASPIFMHPVVDETFRRMRDRVVHGDAKSPKKIFISRLPQPGNRTCLNTDEVETIFEEHGFSIVFPERLSMREQANLFGNAEVVAGFGGSGLYSLLYADSLERLIVIQSESYTGRTEHLMALTRAKNIDYFWNPPVSAKADHKTDWRFDTTHNGPALRRLLSEV